MGLSQRITDDLGRAIVAGSVRPGTILGEASIGARQGVEAGRGAVREAVKMLEAKGLIEARPRRGTAVLPVGRWNLYDRDVQAWMRTAVPTPGLLAELTETRLAFEPAAAAKSARRADPDGLAAIDTAHARMVAAADGRDDPHDADVAFHSAILVASGNRFFAALAPLIETALLHSIRATNAATGDAVGDLAAHTRVRDAVLSARPEAAEVAMRALLADVERTLALRVPGGASDVDRAGALDPHPNVPGRNP